jgi:hypothetical protein
LERDPSLEYSGKLTESIGVATDRVVWANPEAFLYRGVDLRYAVERSLYVALASHPDLMAAFRGAAVGRDAQPPRLGSRLADMVGATVLDRAERPSRVAPRTLAARALYALRSARERAAAAPPAIVPRADAPVLFVLDHLKYLRFVAPVRERLSRPSLVLSTHRSGAVDEHLDIPPDARSSRAVGRGLWGVPSLLGTFDRLVESFARIGPARVVVLEGGGPVDELAGRAARFVGLPSVCLQYGWSPFVHAGFRNMSWTAMGVWGSGFAGLLAPHNPATRFVVTGNPALAAETSEGALAAELGGRRAAAIFLQSESVWITANDMAQMLAVAAGAARALPDAAVLVREHPGAPLAPTDRVRLEELSNVRFVPASEWSLREVIDAADVAVSIYSTSLLEAAALGKPAVIFNPTALPPLEPDLAALGAARRATTPEDAIAALDEMLSGTTRATLAHTTDRFREQYFAFGDTAPQRTAQLIDELV